MEKPYRYRLRPAYGSSELLLEFTLDNPNSEFLKDLFQTISDINPKINSVEDWWMNDEFALDISTDKGSFLLSNDIWGFAFIMAEHNQCCIKFIEQNLNNSSLFEKEETDYENYAI